MASQTNQQEVAAMDFHKSFRVDGHQILFVLINDEDHIPVLEIHCEIGGELVKTAVHPFEPGHTKPVTDEQARYDFAFTALRDVNDESAGEFYQMIKDQWLQANGDVATVDGTGALNRKLNG